MVCVRYRSNYRGCTVFKICLNHGEFHYHSWFEEFIFSYFKLSSNFKHYFELKWSELSITRSFWISFEFSDSLENFCSKNKKIFFKLLEVSKILNFNLHLLTTVIDYFCMKAFFVQFKKIWLFFSSKLIVSQ